MASHRAFRPWIAVVVLISASLALGWVLVFISTGKDDPRRDVGISLIGSSIIGFALALVGEILAASSRRREFLFTISEKNDLTGIDLSGRDLAGQYLVGKNLTRANLSGADLRRANLARSTLQQANLSGAKLDQTVMMDANLTGSYLTGASMTFAIFQNATLDHAVIPFTEFKGTIFTEASLHSTMLVGTEFSTGKPLSFASTLRTLASLYSPAFAKTYRKARMLDPTQVPKSVPELRRDAIKTIQRALPVNFEKAVLTGCDLRGADLRNADLTNAKLSEVFWNDQTRWPRGFEPPPPNPGQPSTPPIPWRDLDKEIHKHKHPPTGQRRQTPSKIVGSHADIDRTLEATHERYSKPHVIEKKKSARAASNASW